MKMFMEKFYRTIEKVFSVVALLAILSSCSQDLTYQEAMNKNRRHIEDSERLDDARFLVDAKSLNVLEVELCELASTSGYASAIVNLAKKHLADHKKMKEELEDLAYREKVSIPSVMDVNDVDVYNKVYRADRQDFDKNFIAAIKEINTKNMKKFLTMATEAKDADVRAYAARKLDVLRTHEERMEEVERELLNTY
jgi:putative membrane protein